ncbi:Uncharacterized protein XB16_3021 [Leptospira santarosai]|uniref:Uncharacterized protein n=1 Tax=Leptospira santarosai TaxID=28183 RepID=A0A2P1QWP0_9LEPT|nr:Uncharacterized protein XB16_3021 [Leptospira santarosai]
MKDNLSFSKNSILSSDTLFNACNTNTFNITISIQTLADLVPHRSFCVFFSTTDEIPPKGLQHLIIPTDLHLLVTLQNGILNQIGLVIFLSFGRFSQPYFFWFLLFDFSIFAKQRFYELLDYCFHFSDFIEVPI